ncbi:uncharacterized protein LOC144433736 [Glandiceps talaboti]
MIRFDIFNYPNPEKPDEEEESPEVHQTTTARPAIERCPDGSQPVNCLGNPCEIAECPLYPNAGCRVNYCGGCNAEFYNGEGRVLNCDEEPRVEEKPEEEPPAQEEQDEPGDVIREGPFTLEDRGCWVEKPFPRAMPTLENKAPELDGFFLQRDDAVRKCAEAAYNLGLKIFALVNGGFCSASEDAENLYQQYGVSDKCLKDGKGGVWANNVYYIVQRDDEQDEPIEEPIEEEEVVEEEGGQPEEGKATPPAEEAPAEEEENLPEEEPIEEVADPDEEELVQPDTRVVGPYTLQNLGCWAEKPFPRAIPSLENKALPELDLNFIARQDALRKCAEAAYNLGLKVFAVSNGGWCSSSENAEDLFQQYGPSSACKPDGEGGVWANQVFRIIAPLDGEVGGPQDVPENGEPQDVPETFDDNQVVILNEKSDVKSKPLIMPQVTESTACAWLRTSATNEGPVMSYVVQGQENEFVLNNALNLQLFVKGEHGHKTGLAINDGHWHHVCAGWSSDNGHWEIFIDGLFSASGANLAKGKEIAPGGILVWGKEIDNGFQGEMAYFNMWRQHLSEHMIRSNARDCAGNMKGNSFSWGIGNLEMNDDVEQKAIDMCAEDTMVSPEGTYPPGQKIVLRPDSDVALDLEMPELSEVTACLWLRSTGSNEGAPFSYTIQGKEFEFLLYDITNLKIGINGNLGPETGIAINDGRWHHVCIVWSSDEGEWELYEDATKMISGDKLEKGYKMAPGGVLVLGQKPNGERGNYVDSNALTGDVAFFNMWGRVLSADDIASVFNDCGETMHGDLYQWGIGNLDIQRSVTILKADVCLHPAIISHDEKIIMNRDSDVALGRPVPELSDLSVCLWMRTSENKARAIFSYAAQNQNEEFGLSNTKNLQLHIRGNEAEKTDLAVNDGNWHHVCITWASDEGNWALYHNGALLKSGEDLSKDENIRPGGIFLLGQSHDGDMRAFVGEMAHFNLWNYVLSDDDIAKIASDCLGHEQGNVFAWRSGYLDIEGSVSIMPADICDSLAAQPGIPEDIVEEDGTLLSYVNLGCWKDTRKRAMESLEGTDDTLGQRYKNREDAIQKCLTVAASRGYTVFGVQHGGQCFSGPNAENSFNRHGPSTRCDADGKGGPWANQVYEIIREKTACEQEILHLECPSGMIHAIHSSYGRHDEDICVSGPVESTNCHSANSERVIRESCEGKSSCTIKAESDVFGDACPGTSKYLRVRFHCQSLGGLNQHESTGPSLSTDACTCVAWGDPHYIQFDGKKHDFMGDCTYLLAKDISGAIPAFIITGKNDYRDGAREGVTLQEYVDIYAYDHMIRIFRNKGGQYSGVWVDSVETRLPAEPETGLHITTNGKYIILSAERLGLVVTWDGNHRVEIKTASIYKGKMVGICGNCDGDSTNDMMKPDGTMATSSVELGDAYLVPDSCTDGAKTIEPAVCADDVKAQFSGGDSCGMMNDPAGPFAECIAEVSDSVIEEYQEGCVYDMCKSSGPEQREQLCHSLGALYDHCLEVGVQMSSFRRPDFCPMQCGKHQTYSESVSGCPDSCGHTTPLDQCNLPSSEGCACDDSYVLSDGECVPKNECGCSEEDGLYHLPGDKWYVNGCQATAVCMTGGEIEETPVAGCHEDAYCHAKGGQYGCHCHEGYEGDGVNCLAPQKLVMNADSDVTIKLAVPELSEVTACMYAMSFDGNEGTLFSYVVNNRDEEFRLSNTGNLVFSVKGKRGDDTNIAINDGMWHHVCVTWSSDKGDWELYVDGTLIASDDKLSKGKTIRPGGTLALGRKQNGQHGAELFGQLAHFNMWDHVLSEQDIDDMAKSCNTPIDGNLFVWRIGNLDIKGDVDVLPADMCVEPYIMDDNQKMILNGDSNVVLSIPIPKLSDVTACVWMRTIAENDGILFSYGVQGQDKEFRLYNYGNLQLFVDGEGALETGIAVNDGEWHHVCAAWSKRGGDWEIFVDSIMRASGDGLRNKRRINRGGVFSLGDNFQGQITNFNLWKRALSATEIEQVFNDCDYAIKGNLFAWSFKRLRMNGDIRLEHVNVCDERNPQGEIIEIQPISDDVNMVVEELGCWKDTRTRAIVTLEGTDDRLDGSYGDREKAFKKCAEAAIAEGYSIIALQNGGWCASSADAEQTYKMYGPSDACADDGEGGPWANQVYRVHMGIPIPALEGEEEEDSDVNDDALLIPESGITEPDGGVINYVSIGCWKDKRKRAMEILEDTDDTLSDNYRKRDDAIRKCAQVAASRGFLVFGVQHGGQCFSGPEAQSTYRKYGSSDRCRSNGKGGSWANQMYEIVSDKLVCEHDTMELHCEIGTIHIVHASFGRSDETTCPGPILTTSCHSPNSMVLVQERCESKQSCSIPASNGVFTDPCGGTKKYLKVGYHCEGADIGNEHGRRKPTVEPGSLLCSAWGDPHYVQFDGEKIDFMGNCLYTLVKDASSTKPDFRVDAKNDYRGDNFDVTLTEYVDVYAQGHHIRLHRDSGGEEEGTWLDGTKIQLPSNPANGLYIERTRKATVVKDDNTGFSVIWDGKNRAEISVSPDYRGKMVGICGNGDTDSKNDMLMPNGVQANSHLEFCRSWEVSCDGESHTSEPKECTPELNEQYGAPDQCGMMSHSEIFQACSSTLPASIVSTFEDACVYDMCHVGKDELCDNLGQFYDFCLKMGHSLPTFRSSNFCPMACQLYSHYSESTSACPDTCVLEIPSEDCPDPNGEDCECDEGFVMSGTECVLREKCGCLDENGGYHKFGDRWVSEDCEEVSTCSNDGMIEYEKMKCHDHAFCGAKNGVYGCHCPSGMLGDGVQECSGGREDVEKYSLGCYKDTEERAIPILEGSDDRLDGDYKERADAITKCALVARDRGFKVFAVQHGGQCFGGADAGESYAAFGRSTECKADGKGGPWANQVYALVHDTLVCEHNALKVDCDGGVIQVVRASYGRGSDEVCPHLQMSDLNCHADNSMDIVKQSCDGQTSCEVDATNQVFGDPCGGTFKYLHVHYICIGKAIQQHTIEFVDLGCYGDSQDRAIPMLDGTDDRLQDRYQDRHNAIVKCALVAEAKGFNVFAVQHGGQCFSGPEAGQTYSLYGESSDCANDGKGGAWANQVYALAHKKVACEHDELKIKCESGIISVVQANYGRTDPNVCPSRNMITTDCYSDTSLEIMRSLCDGQKKCHVKAKNKVFGESCAGTFKYLEAKYMCVEKQGDSGGHSHSHEGKESDVEKLELNDLGCWEDKRDRAVPTLEGEDDGLDGNYRRREDAVLKCAEAARKRGFKVFAVQNGGWCASSGDAGDTYKKYGSSNDCKKDGEGGPWANQVYEII